MDKEFCNRFVQLLELSILMNDVCCLVNEKQAFPKQFF